MLAEQDVTGRQATALLNTERVGALTRECNVPNLPRDRGALLCSNLSSPLFLYRELKRKYNMLLLLLILLLTITTLVIILMILLINTLLFEYGMALSCDRVWTVRNRSLSL